MKSQKNHSTLKYINPGDICGEVGVWRGHLSTEILKHKPSKLHLIDPWKTTEAINRCYSIPQDRMDSIYEDVVSRLGKINNVKIHREFSTDVSFPSRSFNWIYIDGDHSYAAVKKDLEFYYPLMKRGGYLCGDDYGLWYNKPKKGFGSDGGGGPKPAVDEFVKKYNLEIEIIKNQYVIFV